MDSRSLILIVDDQSTSRLALGDLLEIEGYLVAYAATGREALTQMRLLAPDLVLLDVMMPEMDGYEVCRRLRSDPTLALIPVVMITALNDRDSLIQGIEAGADDFISKPFSKTELSARVRTITRLNRFRILLDKQRALTSERAQFRWAIERSADGYLLLDQNDCPQDGNLQGWRYLGLNGRPELGGDTPFRDLAGQLYRLEPEEAWALWPKSSGVAHYLVRPDGDEPAQWLQVELLELPCGAAGSRLVHLQDVTATVSAQRDAWAFHSFVSHKLRTPLTSLLISMGLLNQQAHALPSGLSMLVGTAYNGSQRLKAVIDDIFSYLEAPVMPNQSEGAPLRGLPDLIAQIGIDLGLAEILVSDQFGLSPRRLTVSTHTIELLLLEILENSRKFHPRNNPIVEVSLRQVDGMAVIDVTDDGVHLTPAQLRHIWGPYRQIDGDFTGQVPGVGLGLATVAKVCWAAGGACHMANRLGGAGISVTIELPLAD